MSTDAISQDLAPPVQDPLRPLRRRQDPTIGFFWCLLAVHVIGWTILPQLTQPNVPASTLSLLSAGRELAWGYASQPPLAVWLTSILCWFTAPQIWPVYFLSQLCAGVSCWAAWTLARKFLHPWTALCAAIVLLGGYAFTVSSAAFTGANLAGAFWSLSILGFHEALTRPRRRYWVAAGLFLGLGLLSSYGTLLLFAAMVIFTFWDNRARKCLDSSWPILAIAVMFVVLLPHGLWLANHDFITIRNGMNSASSMAEHFMHPLAFFGIQLLSLMPMMILLAPLVGWVSFKESASDANDDRSFARRLLWWVTCGPPVAIFVLSLVAGSISSMLAVGSVWTFLGIVLLLWSHLDENRLAWRQVILRTGAAAGFFAALLVALNIMLPQVQQAGTDTLFPGPALAHSIQKAWHKSGQTGTIPILIGPTELVQNANWYSGSSAPQRTYDELEPVVQRGKADQQLLQTGGVVIWRSQSDDEPKYQELSERFGRLTVLNSASLPWQTAGQIAPVHVGIAVVQPALYPSAEVKGTQPPLYPMSAESKIDWTRR